MSSSYFRQWLTNYFTQDLQLILTTVTIYIYEERRAKKVRVSKRLSLSPNSALSIIRHMIFDPNFVFEDWGKKTKRTVVNQVFIYLLLLKYNIEIKLYFILNKLQNSNNEFQYLPINLFIYIFMHVLTISSTF